MCVGTVIGQEFYKLVILDTLVQAIVDVLKSYIIYKVYAEPAVVVFARTCILSL